MPDVVRIDNDYSYLLTTNEQLKQRLWRALRVPARNYYFTPAYQARKWDGYKDFFNLRNGSFLSGLLPEVLAALKIMNLPYTVEDNRHKIAWTRASIDDQFLNTWLPKGMKPITLEDYQVDYVNQILRINRGLVTAPAGAGKTYCLISAIKCLPPKTPILFVTDDTGLVDQNYEEMKRWGVENLGRWYGGHKEPNYVMCCNIDPWTFKGIAKMIPKFKVLFADEVHLCMSEMPRRTYQQMKDAVVRVGFSATPFKFAGKDKEQMFLVKGYFGAILKTKSTPSGLLTTKELQERGRLSASECIFHHFTEPTNIIHEPYQDAVTLGIAHNIPFHRAIKKLALSLKGRTLILVERIDQGDYLKQMLPDAHWIRGKTKLTKRAQVFEELREGKNDVITIAMRHIVTAGINVFLHNLINASGGDAEHGVIQQLGRGLRPASDKDILHYYDWIFMTNDYLNDHSMNRVRTLKKEGHKIIVKEELDF